MIKVILYQVYFKQLFTSVYHMLSFLSVFIIEKGRKGEKSGKKNKSKGRLSDDETPKLKKKLKTAAVTP